MFELVKMDIICHVLFKIQSNLRVCQCLVHRTDEIDSICGHCAVFMFITTNFIGFICIAAFFDNGLPSLSDNRDVIGANIFNFARFGETRETIAIE